MSEQNTQQTEEQVVESEERSTNDVVELSWDEVGRIVSVRSLLKRTESDLATMILAYEKRKLQMLDQISQLEEAMMSSAKELQATKGLDEETPYELKLPSKEGEKGYQIQLKYDDENVATTIAALEAHSFSTSVKRLLPSRSTL